ncbi:MAG: tRNA epoxyqueuosine(34) reductase QueG [Deltaproteobacteria bacterium]|nr:tRNA epoxyqueuosine(34) reductase QueG [Deltaproteobacteria bacterium]
MMRGDISRQTNAPIAAKSELTEEIKRLALSLGFARVGVAQADSAALEHDRRRLLSWLEAGHHASMSYLAKSAHVRCDPAHASMLPGVRTIVVLAAPYPRPRPAHGPARGCVAGYAQGRDYHDVLYKKVRKVSAFLRQRGYRSRCSVDSMPVLERAWARIAGLGFIGKNCCLIVPGFGSYVFLSTVLTNAELRPDEPLKRDCGQCDVCLQHCPTGALLDGYLLDARKCISYLTGVCRESIPDDLKALIGDRLLGCDACQQYCPYNASLPATQNTDCAFSDRIFADLFDAERILRMDEQTFNERSRGSALRKVGRERMARNAAIVLGNSGDRKFCDLLPEVGRVDPSALVRDAANWAARAIADRKTPNRVSHL